MPMLEFIARHYPSTWLLVASLYEELKSPDGLARAKEAIRHHLEGETGKAAVGSWRRLAAVCQRTGDILGELHALVELAAHPDAEFDEISNAANRLNALLAEKGDVLDSEEKRILVRRLAAAMDMRAQEADATAFSRLAWLHLKNVQRAQEYVKRGLALDPRNEHCHRLAERLAYSQNTGKWW